MTHPAAAGGPADTAADVAIVFAMPVEADAFERLVEGGREVRGARLSFSTGVVAGRRVAWSAGGVGRAAAATAARQLLDGHRPRLLISAGFAGGLDPALHRGAAVRPALAMAEGTGVRRPLVGSLPPPAAPLTIVTVDAVVPSVEAKRGLAARTAAQLVDMETLAVADVANAAGVPCAAIRVISDDAHESLPREVASLATAPSALRRLGGVLGAVGRRPAAAADLWRLWERAVIDSRTLADALVVAIRDLA